MGYRPYDQALSIDWRFGFAQKYRWLRSMIALRRKFVSATMLAAGWICCIRFSTNSLVDFIGTSVISKSKSFLTDQRIPFMPDNLECVSGQKQTIIELSIVATLYQSEGYIEEFYRRIVATCEQITQSFEVILVNDGSLDSSLSKAVAIHRRDKRVRIIDLSRNFGHHKAIMTGLVFSRGKRVFLIDSDLEEQPELLLSFSQELDANPSLDMVYGVQRHRKGGVFERISGFLYYKAINSITTLPIPENFLTVRLMTRRFVERLCEFQERDMVLSTLMVLTGFYSKSIFVDKAHKGETSYTLKRKLVTLINTVTCSSAKPLWMIFALGSVMTLLSICYTGYVLLSKLIGGGVIDQWASLMMSVWFIGGVLVLSIGVVGIYLSKMFLEVKKRPYVTVREIFDHDGVSCEFRGNR